MTDSESDHDFQKAFYSNSRYWMHGFRDNDVLLQAGYNVIVIFPLGAFQAIFHDGFRKSDHDFLLVVNGNFCPNSNGLEVIRYFLLRGISLLGFFGKSDPQKVKISKNTC